MSQLFVDTIRNRDGNGAPVFDKGVVITGIVTASSISIGVTEVVSSGFQLTNILGLDATTTATIESAVASAPNDFTSLNVSGISTFGSNIDLNSSIDISGHTETNTLNAVGILTASLLSTGAEGSAIRISSNTISGPATLTIDPAGIGTNTGTVVIQGDLQVEGDTTTVNSTTLTVDDKNIILASGSLTDASSDGGGITLESGEGNKTINWVDSTDSWTFSENIDLASSKTFKINGVDILSATTLGSSVVNSSLTSVGTLTTLNVSGDLDVDGHTNLDNVNISGIVTSAGGFSGNIYINESVDDDADYNIMMLQTTGGGNAYKPVMVDNGGIEFNPSLNKLNLQGTPGVQIHGTSGSIEAVNVNLSGIVTATTINATTFVGDGDFVELDVDGHTNLDNVTVGGAITATTFTGALDGNATTATTAGTVTTAAQPNITSLGTLSAVTVSGLADLNGDLDVDGHTNLDNVSIAGITTVGLTTVLETGILTHDLNVSGVSTFNGDIRLTEQDGSGIYFGESLDFAIAHDGNNSYVFERGGTGNVYIAGSNEVIIADASGAGPNPADYVTETKARFVTNGPVRLYYDNVEKFATAGSGATVYGTFTADTLSVSGVSTFTGDIDVDGHTNLDNVSISGIVTATQGVVDGAGNLRTLPQLSKSSAYVLIASDTGKHISITTGGVTVPSGVFSAGDVVTIFNNSSSSQTITQAGSVTLRQAATTNTGNRTLAEYGVATVMCVAANTFVISGAGLS
tara:strand:+ start:964 stop:3204 length:2241 start_codon:yes stop_codon:yes gene_type:complete